MKRYVIGFLIIATSVYAQEFVVKHKKKRVTSSHVKEQIGQMYEEVSKLSSRAICSLSSLNPALVDRTKDLINGEVSTDIVMLEKHLAELESMKSQLIIFEKQINAMVPVLNHKIGTDR